VTAPAATSVSFWATLPACTCDIHGWLLVLAHGWKEGLKLLFLFCSQSVVLSCTSVLWIMQGWLHSLVLHPAAMPAVDAIQVHTQLAPTTHPMFGAHHWLLSQSRCSPRVCTLRVIDMQIAQVLVDQSALPRCLLPDAKCFRMPV
jgi:hypothetical protein